MSLARWSLKKVQFLLSHIEDFVEDDSAEILKRVAAFEVQCGLDKLEALIEPGWDPLFPSRVFEKPRRFTKPVAAATNARDDRSLDTNGHLLAGAGFSSEKRGSSRRKLCDAGDFTAAGAKGAGPPTF